jgi:hypothetical protein
MSDSGKVVLFILILAIIIMTAYFSFRKISSNIYKVDASTVIINE